MKAQKMKAKHVKLSNQMIENERQELAKALQEQSKVKKHKTLVKNLTKKTNKKTDKQRAEYRKECKKVEFKALVIESGYNYNNLANKRKNNDLKTGYEITIIEKNMTTGDTKTVKYFTTKDGVKELENKAKCFGNPKVKKHNGLAKEIVNTIKKLQLKTIIKIQEKQPENKTQEKQSYNKETKAVVFASEYTNKISSLESYNVKFIEC